MTEAPPGFLRLAGHPLRWRLLAELARSDRQVCELTGLLGQRQSLVSYHPGQLKSGGLVAARRSSADGRDAYYRVDLARCGELLASAGQALHEHGLDISGCRAKHLDVFGGQRFGSVVTLCDRVREVCPEFPGHPEAIHWSIPDPSGEPDGYQAFRRVAAELRTRIGLLLARIAGDGG